LPSPLEELHDDRLLKRAVRLLLKRDDLIHPEIPGNKWRKLKYNLTEARSRGQRTLLTFGGAYSNHIRATAAAGWYFGFSTIGVIRGEEHLPLNPSLAYAVETGMRLTYLDRTTYRRKSDADIAASLREEFGEFYLLPEGGSNALAVRGCAEITPELNAQSPQRPDIACCACGTGATLAGIAGSLRDGQRAIGFSALRGGDFLVDDVARLQQEAFGAASGNWTIERDFDFGGYAKRRPALDDFIQDFQRRHGIALEWVYVAKMLYGVFALVESGRIAPHSTVVAVLTG
jgi:1-aminocyclopropane-1-carboxylate deaminase